MVLALLIFCFSYFFQGQDVDENVCMCSNPLRALANELFEIVILFVADTANAVFDFIYLYNSLIVHFGVSARACSFLYTILIIQPT